MDYEYFQSGFFFTPVKTTGLWNQYSCYVVHLSGKYQRGLAYPSSRLERFDVLGESYLIVHARNRKVAERKVRKTLRKYSRKNIL